MTDPLIEMQDAARVVVNWITALKATVPFFAAYHVAGRLDPHTTPVRFIRVRRVDGDESHGLLDKAVLQVQVWGDRTAADDEAAMQGARRLGAHMRRDLRARVVSTPVLLPDPTSGVRNVAQFSIELPLRGVAL